MVEARAQRQGFEVLLLLAGLLVIVSLSACGRPDSAPEPRSPELAGHYTIAGFNRDGSEYTGKVEISKLGELLYWLEWQDPDGSYTGKGALVGDTLFAVWGSEAAQCSAVFLSVGSDGGLDGFWFQAQDGSTERGTMTARPEDTREELDLEGRYEVTASALAGSTFPPALEITALGESYLRLRWDGEEAREGIGLLDMDQIQAVVSPAASEGQCGRSRMTLDADGNLIGTWMINDEKFRTLGREKMTRR